MDLGKLLLLQVVIFGAMAAWSAIRGAERMPMFAAINIAFVGIAGAAWQWAPWLWPAILGAFVIVDLVPHLAVLVSIRLPDRMLRTRYALNAIAYYLHPSAARRTLWDLTRAAHLRRAGRDAEADALLATQHAAALMIRLEQMRLDHRWHDVLVEIEAQPAAERTPMLGLYLRALGEVGQLDRLVDEFVGAEPALRRGDRPTAAIGELAMAAFHGRRDLVERLCAGPLRELDAETRAFWLATAAAAAGDPSELDAFVDTDHERIRQAVAYRKAHPIIVREPSAAATAALDRIAAHLADEAAHGDAPAVAIRPIMTYVAIGLVVSVHVAVTFDDPYKWLEHGMLWGWRVLDHDEWWRLVTAGLLHVSWAHLAFNVLAFWLFAPFVERTLGKLRFAVVFTGGSIGGFAIVIAIVALGLKDPQSAAVGASAAAMALIGATIAISVLAMVRHGSRIARARLQSMAFFVAIQIVFDLVTPQVSLAGHAGGLVVGFVLGLVLARRSAPP